MLPDNRSPHSIHFVINPAGAFLLLLLLTPVAFSQSKPPTRALGDQVRSIEFRTEEDKLAARSIAALKRLENLVLNHESLGDFEANRKLARVSFEHFKEELENVTRELEPLLSCLPRSKLKTQITNALYSYRDGAFWWSKINKPRVIDAGSFYSKPRSDASLESTIPYTVVIHWRQARKHVRKAEAAMSTRE